MEQVNQQADNTGSNYLTLLHQIVKTMRSYTGSLQINHELAETLAWDLAGIIPTNYSLPQANQLTVREVLDYAEHKSEKARTYLKLNPTRFTDNRHADSR